MLKITNYGTILTEENSNFTEITINDFANTIKNNYNTGTYYVSYTNGNEYFDVVFDGIMYKLMINKEEMDNYKIGIYSNITKLIQDLINIHNSHISSKDKEKRSEEERQTIIANAKKGHILTEKEQEIYLANLRKELKPSLRNVDKYFKNLGLDWKKSIKSIVGDAYFEDVFYSWSGLNLIGLFISYFAGLAIGIAGGNEVLAYIPLGVVNLPMAVGVISTIGVQIKNRVNRLGNYFKGKKQKKEVINLIRSYKFNKETAEQFEQGIENTQEQIDYLKTRTTDLEFYNLIEQAKKLEDISVVLPRISTLFTEYSIIRKKNDGFALTAELYKSNILNRINEIRNDIEKQLYIEKDAKETINSLNIIKRRIDELHEVKEDILENQIQTCSENDMINNNGMAMQKR